MKITNLNSKSLKIQNPELVVNELTDFIKDQVFNNFRKKGVVVGLSGGIDSSLITALSTKALGKNRVFGLLMPEKESSPNSEKLAKKIAKNFGITTEKIDMTPILDSYKIYKTRNTIVEKYFPKFNETTKFRIALSKNTENSGVNIPFLDILHENKNSKMKISLYDFLALSAATTIKLRTRMTMLYYYAEQKNFLVIGTTNKSEELVGNFVKYGDGGVDIEPLANLYKTQIFQLSNFLKIPEEIIEQKASPDTWSYPISDEDFFYGMPYNKFDLILYAKENNFMIEDVARSLKLEKDLVEQTYLNIEHKIKNSQHMREMPPKWNPADSILKK
jgi:NAD+ synthase